MNFRLSDTTTVLPMVSMWPARPDRIAPVVRDLSFRYRDTVRLDGLIARMDQQLAEPSAKLFSDPARMAYLLPRLERIRQEFHAVKQAGRDIEEFAESVMAFQRLLASQATGKSVDSLYLEAPAGIRDFIELGYGSLNQPIFKLFEKMLYQDRYFDASQESLRFFCKASDQEYSPVRVQDPGELSWSIPFADERIDRLFSADLAPMPAQELAEILQISSEDERIKRYFCSTAADASPPWGEDSTRIRYFGHACVLLERNGVSVLVDPLIPVNADIPGAPRYSFGDLPATLDYVLITHAHADHFDIGSLLRLRHRTRCLVVPASTGELGDISLKHLAEKLGFRNVVALDCLDSIAVPGLEIMALPFLGEHGDLVHGKASWLVRLADDKVLLAADSKYVNTRIYEKIRQLVGPIATVFIGTCCTGDPVTHHYSHLFAWAPEGAAEGRFTEGSNAEQAWNLVRDVGAKAVYVYALGLEAWNAGLLGTTPQIYVQEAAQLVQVARTAGLSAAKMLHGAETLLI